MAVIAEEADTLWGPDPERSYRLVAEALARLDESTKTRSGDALEVAVARLRARARENAMPR